MGRSGTAGCGPLPPYPRSPGGEGSPLPNHTHLQTTVHKILQDDASNSPAAPQILTSVAPPPSSFQSPPPHAAPHPIGPGPFPAVHPFLILPSQGLGRPASKDQQGWVFSWSLSAGGSEADRAQGRLPLPLLPFSHPRPSPHSEFPSPLCCQLSPTWPVLPQRGKACACVCMFRTRVWRTGKCVEVCLCTRPVWNCLVSECVSVRALVVRESAEGRCVRV